MSYIGGARITVLDAALLDGDGALSVVFEASLDKIGKSKLVEAHLLACTLKDKRTPHEILELAWFAVREEVDDWIALSLKIDDLVRSARGREYLPGRGLALAASPRRPHPQPPPPPPRSSSSASLSPDVAAFFLSDPKTESR